MCKEGKLTSWSQNSLLQLPLQFQLSAPQSAHLYHPDNEIVGHMRLRAHKDKGMKTAWCYLTLYVLTTPSYSNDTFLLIKQ